MIKTKVIQRNCEVTEDILCDTCGKSTKDISGMSFEHSLLIAHWGYGSKRDGTSWEFYLCENCSEQVVQWIVEKQYENNVKG